MRRVIPFRRMHERRGEELAFLPAALEIVETPPSPIGRAIGVTIILLFCAALVWAWWGTIDIVASATGKIVPSGRTKVIQPFETGVVRSIRAQDGQVVKAGDVLIELDPMMNEAECSSLAAEVSRDTVARFERGGELKAITVEAIQDTLERAGVVFIDAHDGGPSARLQR